MFFSLIRAPNQLPPKTKVVHLLFLYNLYFGQITSFHMKFGVLDGQTLVKINSNEFNSVTVPPLFCQSPADLDIGAPPRVAPTNLARRARAPSLSPQSRVRFPLPFSFLTRVG